MIEIENAMEIQSILKTLKQQFKNRGLTYHDVAKTLKLSQTTIKRYLSGHGLTVDWLARLCAVADLRMFDLLELAREAEETTAATLTIDQESRLASDPFLGVIITLLRRGWSPAKIQSEFGLSTAEINKYLADLEKTGLVTVFPFNKIRFKAGRKFLVSETGPMRRAFQTTLKDDFVHFDTADPNALWRFTYFKLSQSSLLQIKKLLDELNQTIAGLAAIDENLLPGAADWRGLLFLMRPVDLLACRQDPKRIVKKQAAARL